MPIARYRKRIQCTQCGELEPVGPVDIPNDGKKYEVFRVDKGGLCQVCRAKVKKLKRGERMKRKAMDQLNKQLKRLQFMMCVDLVDRVETVTDILEAVESYLKPDLPTDEQEIKIRQASIELRTLLSPTTNNDIDKAHKT